MTDASSPTPDSERADTVAAIAAVLAGARADQVVTQMLRARPWLDNDGRRRIARRVHGVCVLRRRLAWLEGTDAAAALLSSYIRTVEQGEGLSDEQARWPADPIARIGVRRSCPDWIVRELVAALGLAGADAFLAASNEPAPAALRANTLHVDRDALRARLAEEGIATRPAAHAPHGLIVIDRANLFGSQAWRRGFFEVQDEASQLAAEACAARPGEVVVDVCAGRGGKTLALAAAMENQGELWFDDVDERALGDLALRARRAGVRCLRRGAPPPGTASVVLVDAPCSSWGPLRRSPDLRWRSSPAALSALAPLQLSLLKKAAALARLQGRVVYVTCTVRQAENEDVVRALTLCTPGLRLESARLWLPHVEGTDGFYIAVFRKVC